MRPPPEFHRLAELWHMDFFLDDMPDDPTEAGIVTTLLAQLTGPEKHAVKQFLTDLLKRNPSDAELEEMWQATRADWLFGDPRGLRKFLQMIRDEIA